MLSPEAKEHLDLVFAKFERARQAKAAARATHTPAVSTPRASSAADRGEADKAFDAVMEAMASARAEGSGPPRADAEPAQTVQRREPDDAVSMILSAMASAREGAARQTLTHEEGR